jgi:alcohol dehydrogenase (cytochrome c)
LVATALTLSVSSFAVRYEVVSAQANPGPGWTTPAGTVQGTRFSALSEINTGNVATLVEEFSFRTGVNAGHEGAPLVVGTTMYVVGPFPNRLFALDLANGGRLLWTFNPNANRFARDKACCDIVNRGAVYAAGKIIYNVLDNTTVAVNATTGQAVWRHSNGNPATGQSMTMAPLVVGNKVLVGNSGGELGVRGFIAALDLDTGTEVWRAWSTGPDADVKIGPRFRPFYAKDTGTNLGVATWPASPPSPGKAAWELGGSTVWGYVSYDPVLNLIYHGTANPGVWNADMRPGDNKWSTSVFARDPNTGEALWAYQVTPHDSWDFDGINENIVADLVIAGQPRKVLVRFDRYGFAYTMDRQTGQVLVAEKFVFANWASRIDLATGLPVEDPAKRTHEGVNVLDICPAAPGGKDHQPAAFSPQTGLFYVPTNNLCMDYEGLKALYFQGSPFVGAMVIMKAGPGGNRGEFMAWDAVSGKKVWGIKERFPVWSGVLATAGNLAFYGTLDRDFKAVDATTGAVVFTTRLESGIIGSPMTFVGADGKQRIAVYSGPGGWAGGVVPGKLSTDDPTAGLGAVGALADLPMFTPAGGSVHVFKLR